MNYEIKWLLPKDDKYLTDKNDLLEMFSMTQDDDIENIIGIIDKGHLIAMAAICGKLLKQFVVHPDYQGKNIIALLVAQMRKYLFDKGYSTCQIYTAPCNEHKFINLGFKLLATSDKAILLESGSDGIDKFQNYLRESTKEGLIYEKKCGCVVINANPFTIGHKYLVENALTMCELLFIIIVEEDRSFFPYKVRKRLIEEGCKGLKNIVIVGGGDYVISSATFPKYFIKQADDQARSQAQLDLDIFTKYIAPTLNITVRFVGEESDDPLTEIYNRTMEHKLNKSNIKFIEIPRKKLDDQIISASIIRKAFLQNDMVSIKKMLPESTFQYLSSNECLILKQKYSK